MSKSYQATANLGASKLQELERARILMALLTSATAQKDTDRQPHRGSSQARVIDVYHRQRNTKDAETAQDDLLSATRVVEQHS